MTKSVRLSEELFSNAQKYGAIYSRTAPMQIEYWAKIGKLAEENSDLPYSFIKDILIAKQQFDDGDVVPFDFD